MFNTLVIAVDDIAYLEGPLLAHASPSLATTAVIAMMMSGVVMAALQFARRKRTGTIDAAVDATFFALFALNVLLTAVSGAPQ
jgi:cation:H+ antiporter